MKNFAYASLIMLTIAPTAMGSTPKPPPSSPTSVDSAEETVHGAVDAAIEKTEQVHKKITEIGAAAEKKVEKAARDSRALRGRSSFYVGADYTYFDLLLPSKWGATMELTQDADHAWSLEYLRASVTIPFVIEDLGKFTEQRLSLLRRHYGGSNSFNFFWSAFYNSMELKLGNKYIDHIPNAHVRSIKLVEIDTLGLGAGLGNRWQFASGITLGVDWFTWSQPLTTLKHDDDVLEQMTNEDDKNSLRAALRWMTYFPRWTVAKFQLGYAF